MLKIFKVILYSLLMAAVSLIILFLQKHLQSYLPYLRLWIERALILTRSPLAWGLGFGLIFGLASCPVCGVPLTLYIAGREDNIRAAFLSVAGFALGRFVVFLCFTLFAVLAGLALTRARFIELLPFGFITAGILMLALGLALFKQAKLIKAGDCSGCLQKSTHIIPFRSLFEKVRNFPALKRPRYFLPLKIKYVFWGGLLGAACSLEGLGFVIPVWFNALARGSITYALWCVCFFCAGAFIPPLVMVLTVWCGIHCVPERIKNRILTPARCAGALVLIIIGYKYVRMGIINAQNLLVGF